ncbi:MAG: response regulator [Pyrinomonadaceae bacterium]
MSTRILIADNNRTHLMVMKEFFEAQGFEIDTASSSIDVWRLLDRQPAVMILDTPLDNHNDEQDTSGLLVAKTISILIPIIIFTSYTSVEAVREAFGANCYGLPAVVDFISKSEEGLEVLLEVVQTVVSCKGADLGLPV